MMKRTPLSQSVLKEALVYSPRTGLFTWLIGRREGDTAGTFSGRYVRIKLDGRQYPAHCLVWLYMTGAWPEQEIDHKNTDPFDNRWRNLRPATRVQNAYNAKPHKKKMYSQLKGVSFAKGRKKWTAFIHDGSRSYARLIGYFDTAEAAHAAYAQRAKELRGAYARVS